jgi:hypothetical protein
MTQNSEANGSEAEKLNGFPMFQLGKNQTEAMIAMQKEMLAVCEEASRCWIDRVKSEIELWTDLAAKLSASHSVPDGIEAYRDCVTQRVKMAADDGQRLLDDGRKIFNAVTGTLSAGAPTATT